MTRMNFIFNSVQLMYYKCHKGNVRCGGSYLHSPYLIKKTKTTIKTKNEDNKCFQYVIGVALDFRETESHSERVSNVKLFIFNITVIITGK